MPRAEFRTAAVGIHRRRAEGVACRTNLISQDATAGSGGNAPVFRRSVCRLFLRAITPEGLATAFALLRTCSYCNRRAITVKVSLPELPAQSSSWHSNFYRLIGKSRAAAEPPCQKKVTIFPAVAPAAGAPNLHVPQPRHLRRG